jgi:hypothetical protein
MLIFYNNKNEVLQDLNRKRLSLKILIFFLATGPRTLKKRMKKYTYFLHCEHAEMANKPPGPTFSLVKLAKIHM